MLFRIVPLSWLLQRSNHNSFQTSLRQRIVKSGEPKNLSSLFSPFGDLGYEPMGKIKEDQTLEATQQHLQNLRGIFSNRRTFCTSSICANTKQVGNSEEDKKQIFDKIQRNRERDGELWRRIHLSEECKKEQEPTMDVKEKVQEKKSIYAFKEFSIFSYNILANCFVDKKYVNNDQEVMKWVNRKKSIFKDIKDNLSDIICLQEIEEEYFNEIEKKLNKLGYKGLYIKKKRETCKDGVCIFYNTNKFELLFFDEVVFDKSELLKRWQVGLIVALRNLKSKKIENGINTENMEEKDGSSIPNLPADDIVIVSNTHLLFDTMKGDVKLYQLCYLTYRILIMLNKCMNLIKENQKKWKESALIDVQRESQELLKPCVVFCGDLNFTPNSLLYYFMTNRFLNLNDVHLLSLSGQYLMFQKQFYFNNFKKGEKIENIFDESIINDLKEKQAEDCKDNMKQDALLLFFKNKNIVDENYILDLFKEQEPYLCDYNKLEHEIEKRKKKRNKEKSNEIIEDEETKSPICTNYCNKTKSESKETNIDPSLTETSKDDFIYYYPLFFKSIYHSKTNENEEVEEKPYYEYDSIEQLNSEDNHLQIKNFPFTVFHGHQKGCVDYIFYTFKNLQVLSCNSLPSFDTLHKHGCLPNKKYPGSDHLYLHATLRRRHSEDLEVNEPSESNT